MFSDYDWILYVAAFASAFVVTLVSTPFTKKIAHRLGALSYPSDRGMHKVPIPQLGGLAMVLGFFVASGLLACFVPSYRTLPFAGFIGGAVVTVAAGMLDDMKDIKARTKLLFQIAAALLVIFSGTRIEIVFWPTLTQLKILSGPFTFLWIIGMTNAINLIDGLDGLAAGVSAIGAICLMVLCALSDNPMALLLSATLAGCCLGFLPRNFNPAEVIMGDTGALFLGYVLAVSSILGVFKGYTLLAVLVVFFALALPIFDTLFGMMRRLRKGRSFMNADKGHFHHRLIDAGYSHKNAVLLLYGLSSASAVIAVVIAVRDIRAIIITALFVLSLGFVLFLYRKRTEK
jgi:UDP-GlcNAc:undecaprenyl-phosphate GlcNAc-1-phosphate transferase